MLNGDMENIKEKIFGLLSNICDPEIPVINIVEMGIVRDAYIIGDSLTVDITPTYSGCPAMTEIRNDIEKLLIRNGYQDSKINTIYNPAWTTDWMHINAINKLREYGIAPPPKSENQNDLFFNVISSKKNIQCPFCGSYNTKVSSEFGSTACKSLHYCNECIQPFEHFKCH